MAAHFARRQIGLFLGTIIFPMAVLIAFGVRMVQQEQELADQRTSEERRRAVIQLRRELVATLERIKLAELARLATLDERGESGAYAHPAVRLVARIEGGEIILPWEAGSALNARSLLRSSRFAERIASGERAEMADRDVETAIVNYSKAAAAAEHPLQQAYARLLRARALTEAGRTSAARALYRELLQLPSDLVDEEGVPLALYAASWLLRDGQSDSLVLERIRVEHAPPRWQSPVELYLLRDLASGLDEDARHDVDGPMLDEMRREIERRLGIAERALKLKREFPELGLRYPAGDPRASQPLWLPYGESEWLVTSSAVSEDGPEAVVAVDTHDALEIVNAASDPSLARIVTTRDSSGELLGAGFPGLGVKFMGPADGRAGAPSARVAFYLAILLFLLGVVVFGAYLTVRDVGRELRMAELRSQFVSSVSHELKTPLTAIRMFAETLRSENRRNPERETEYLDTIVGESERLTRLLNNLLDLSSIERDKKTYRPRPVDADEVLERAIRAMRYPLEREGFELVVEAEDAVPAVVVDPDALEQAILNLLTNAMKYSDDEREIGVRLATRDRHVVIEVRDHGIGIPADELERLTEKFYRAPTPEKERIPGTGLGLTLVEHMVKAHGGRLVIESEVGRGSTFALHLPIEDPV